MIILGLTGSIGMGKSTVAAMFRRLHVPVFDADAVVHALQAPSGAALPAIAEAFPDVIKAGFLDRVALGTTVFGDGNKLTVLEAIIYPLVGTARNRFLFRYRTKSLVVLDIPLLFERGGFEICDLVAVVSASANVQRKRVLAREGMTINKYEAILGRQVSDIEKRKRADIIISTDRSLVETRRTVQAIVTCLGRSVR